MTIEQNFSKWLFAQDCKFVASSSDTTYMPKFNLPEIAFVGRSNVGKSSLINLLTNRKSLAKVSNTPGRTRQLNFFSLAEKIILVDLPGYGYAKASKKEIEGWNKIIYKYLKSRSLIKRIFLLIDSRRGVNAKDELAMNLLDEIAVNYQIILTKSDKTTRFNIEQILHNINLLIIKHSALHPETIVTSSRFKNHGIKDIQNEISSFVM